MANGTSIYAQNAEFNYFSITDKNESLIQSKSVTKPAIKQQNSNAHKDLTMQVIADHYNNFYCEICNLRCDNHKAHEAHLNGAKHKRNQLSYNLLNEHPEYLSSIIGDYVHSSINMSYRCEICAITIDGVIQFHNHNHSQKHLKVVRKLEKNQNPDVSVEMIEHENKPKLMEVNAITSSISNIDLEYIEQDDDCNWLRCITCESRFTKNLLQSHLNGFKHKTITQDKLDYIAKGGEAADFKPRKLRKRKAAATEKFWESQLIETKKEELELHISIRKFSIFDEKHLNQKFKSITIGQEKYKNLTAFVMNCEKALKLVSDEMLNEDLASDMDASTNDELREAKRILKSVMRVGPFLQSTMLSIENTAECIILVSVIPTVGLLQRISQHLANKIKEIYGEIEVLVHMGEGEILVSLVNADGLANLECIFHITSPLYNEPDQEIGREDANDILNKDKGIQLLRILRRCKWFQVCLKHFKQNNIILTILRDICARDEIWSHLDPWVIELMLEKVYTIINVKHGISAVFRLFFEMISSGFLINDDIILLDPCEKDETLVLTNLTIQQKEDLTKSAQHYLRLISMKRINEVLNIDQIKVFNNRFRRYHKRQWPKKQKLDENLIQN